MYLRIK